MTTVQVLAPFQIALQTTLLDLAHDLRQPLSHIENIAYILDRIAPPDDQRSRDHVRELRRRVIEASWMIEGALQMVCLAEPKNEECDLNELAKAASERTHYSDEYRLEVETTPGIPPVYVDAANLNVWIDTALVFFRAVAVAHNPVRGITGLSREGVFLRLRAEAEFSDAAALLALADPAESSSASVLRRIAEHLNSRFSASVEQRYITLELLMPAVSGCALPSV